MGSLVCPVFATVVPQLHTFFVFLKNSKILKKSKVLKNSKIVRNSKNVESFKKSEKIYFFLKDSQKIDIFNDITSVMFNAYLISTLKFQFEKNAKFNYITSAMFNAFSISTLTFEKIKYF